MVLLLGVFSLLALSSTVDTETSLTALNRGVRQASKSKGRGGLKRRSKGRKVGKGKKLGKKRGLKAGQGKKRKGGKGKKSAKKGGLQKRQEGNRKGGTGKKAANGKDRKERGGRRRKNKGKGGKRKRNNANKIQKQRNFKKQRKEKIDNRQTAGCSAFYTDLPGYRYDQNQLRKLLRINRTIVKISGEMI